MKRYKSNRLVRALGVTLISTAGLYGLSSTVPTYADFFPQLTEEPCMGEAAGFGLNCSANDIRVGSVTDIKNTDGSPGPVECTLGGDAEFLADVTIVTTAKKRYDYAVWLPEGDWSPQDFSTTNTCSILIGEADGLPGEDLEDDPLDTCADISKPPGTHLYDDQVITLNCQDADGDGKADFNYCTSWNQQAETSPSCDGTAANAPVPGAPSKCLCETFNIDVFIKPGPPTITKTLLSTSSANEPGGIFKYKLDITNTSTVSDIVITDVRDIVRSTTDAAVFANFDLTSAVDTTVGNLTLLGTHADNTCDTVLALPLTLTPAAPTASCVLVMKIEDDDLPDDGTDEIYKDFIRLSVEDKNGSDVGDDTCDPTATPPVVVTGATCSGVVTVAIQDVDPDITIDKFAIAGPGYACVGGTVDLDGKCSGTVYIDEPGGDVTFKLVITNTSTADPLTISSLEDLAETVNIDVLALGADTTCDESLPINLAIGGSFTCTFVRDVSGEPRTVTNTATVQAAESTGHSEGNTATDNDMESVTITDVAPTVALMKEVKIAGDDDSTYAESVEVNEPGGDVVYRFTTTNTSPSGEAITLLSLTDLTLAGDRVTVDETSADTTCAFDGSVTIQFGMANAYQCTIAAFVTGEPDSPLLNTAYVTVQDNEGNEVNSNTDSANVTFADLAPIFDAEFAFSTVVYVRISNGGFEDATLTDMRIRNQVIPASGFTIVEDGMRMINDGNDRVYDIAGDGEDAGDVFPPCELDTVIAASSAYQCHVKLELVPGFDSVINPENVNFSAQKSGVGGVKVTLEDPEGNAVAAEVDLVVTSTEPSPP